jgi:hypothetical protein
MLFYGEKKVTGRTKNARKKSRDQKNKIIDVAVKSIRKLTNIKFKQNIDYSISPQTFIGNEHHIVYVLRHVRTGCAYIGVHSSAENDILVKYFTSSKLVNKIIEVEGISAFSYEHAIYASNRDMAEQIERYLIKINWHSKISLNRSFKSANGVVLQVKYSDTYHGVPIHECFIFKQKPAPYFGKYGDLVI